MRRITPFASLALAGCTPGIAWASSGPFGVALPDSPVGNRISGPLAPLLQFAMRMQTHFYQKLTAALGAFVHNPHAGFWLVGLSFAYGVFHAVGPGHGKAVIASYLVATGDTRRRAVLLSIAASLLQAVVAVTVVSLAVIVFNTTAAAMTRVSSDMAVFSYGLVSLLGLKLTISRARAMIAAWRYRQASRSAFFCEAIPAGVTSVEGLPAGGSNMIRHGINCACAEMGRLAVTFPRTQVREMLATVVSIGVRPCSGALIVLVFALSRHLYPAGIASVFAMAGGTALTVSLVALVSGTARNVLGRLASFDSGATVWLSVSLQFAAAVAVFAFGLLMLAGMLLAKG